jgi:hypothetical protein
MDFRLFSASGRRVGLLRGAVEAAAIAGLREGAQGSPSSFTQSDRYVVNFKRNSIDQ